MTPRTYGLLVNGQTAAAPPAPDLRAVLVSVGIVPVGEIRECKDARRRSKAGTSWIAVLPTGAKIPADVWARFGTNPYRDGNILIVELK